MLKNLSAHSLLMSMMRRSRFYRTRIYMLSGWLCWYNSRSSSMVALLESTICGSTCCWGDDWDCFCGTTRLAKKYSRWSQLEVVTLVSLCFSARIPLAGPSMPMEQAGLRSSVHFTFFFNLEELDQVASITSDFKGSQVQLGKSVGIIEVLQSWYSRARLNRSRLNRCSG